MTEAYKTKNRETTHKRKKTKKEIKANTVRKKSICFSYVKFIVSMI